MSMITIDQLLESVDLVFEPRWVTKDENGTISFHGDETKPRKLDTCWAVKDYYYEFDGCLKVAEFTNKPWQECIYEVPRKVDYSKWIGKLCVFGKGAPDEKYGVLAAYDPESEYPFFIKGYEDWYVNCEPVRPDDDVIYKRE